MKRYVLFWLLFVFCFTALAQVANTSVTPLASATYTAATVNSADQTNFGYRGLHVIINVTTATTGTYTPHIQAKDPVSGNYYDILVGSAISTAGMTVLKVYPGIGALANATAADLVPQTWRVQLIGASTPNMVLSVAAYLEI